MIDGVNTTLRKAAHRWGHNLLEQQTQAEVLRRLHSLESNVQAMLQMTEDGRPCGELIQQARALRTAMRQVSIILLRSNFDCGEEQTENVVQLHQELLALIRQVE